MPENIVIVGGGASGLMAAIFAAQNQNRVIILEHKDRVGKKILMTGNGKCNLTNMSDLHGKYYSDDINRVYQILDAFPAQKVRDFFAEIGLYTKEKRDGGVYPASEQAATVLDALRLECVRRKVEFLTNCNVSAINLQKDTGYVTYQNMESQKQGKLNFDKLILATGGKASPVAGSDGSGYQLAKQIGHSVIKPLPALVQLKCDGDYFKSISGVRAQANLKLYIAGNYIVEEAGELQLTDYGISGIPTFQISRFVSKALDQKKRCDVHIDFLTYMSQSEKEKLTSDHKKFADRTLEEYLSGLVHKKIALMICKQLGIKTTTLLQNISKEKWIEGIGLLSDFVVHVKQTNAFEQAQVCCGGVPLKEITNTMQSCIDKRVYITGELLDCDGICGGYNLQWAWTTGALAGRTVSI